MRISDWSSDVCSSDLDADDRNAAPTVHPVDQGSVGARSAAHPQPVRPAALYPAVDPGDRRARRDPRHHDVPAVPPEPAGDRPGAAAGVQDHAVRSEEHTSELQSLMRISYAVFCLKKKKKK